jgi:hypothetical protein
MIWRALVGAISKLILSVAMLAVSWFGGRKSAQADAKIKALEARFDAAKDAEDVRNEVEALDRNTLRSRAVVWVRSPKR